MIDLNRNNVLTFISILVLVLGFQNCGNSSYQNADSVRNEPASSLITNDTKYRGGLNFEVVGLYSGSSDLISSLSISKNENGGYKLVKDGVSQSCFFENPNSSEELMQITEISTLSHPSRIVSDFDVCDSSEGGDIFYAVGSQSKIYLVFKSENEDCYTGDPQKLMDQNKRVFVVDNLFIEDVEELVEAVKQDLLSGSNCTAPLIPVAD